MRLVSEIDWHVIDFDTSAKLFFHPQLEFKSSCTSDQKSGKNHVLNVKSILSEHQRLIRVAMIQNWNKSQKQKTEILFAVNLI